MSLTKTILMCLMILLTASGFVATQNSREQEVRKLERAWLDAYEQRDQKAMNEIVADEFVITFPSGSTQTKPQIIESLKKPIKIAKFSFKFYTENVEARVFGDTVILRGRVITERVSEGATVSKEESLYTDTYIKRNGRWQVVVSHLSNAPAKQK